VYSPLGSREVKHLEKLPGGEYTKESFWTPESHSTNFKDNTTTFEETIVIKINSELLHQPKDI
jgi:hypothetical protein